MPVKDKSGRRSEVRAWINDYKRTLRCGRCGFSHPAALQFHHTDSSTKKFEIGSAVGLLKTVKQVQEEIQKCEVICANCHMVHHYEERTQLEADRQAEEAWYYELTEDIDGQATSD
jgi:DNA-directed RNA polymerase subunit M/transcription elongation factor TFIIS